MSKYYPYNILPDPETLDKLFNPELQRLRREADMLFSRLRAKKRLYDLWVTTISLDDIKKLQLQYDEAERLCQLKRKELGLPYILQEED